MAQSKQQFTPDQILEAGRRAEAQGQTDYALQFYKHLMEHHAASTEAAAAREALARLIPRGAVEAKPPAYRNGATSWAGPEINRDPPSRDPPPREPPPRDPSLREVPRTSPPLESRTTTQRVRESARTELDMPPPARGYLIGRIVAGTVVAFGAVLLFFGLAMTGFAVLTGAVPFVPPVGPPGAIGVALAVLGFVIVFAGQVALAIFETANATRDSAAVLRTIADDIARRRW